MSVKEWQIKHDEDSFDGPARQGKSVRNPFNDYDGLKDYRDNSLGFYAGDLPYRQPFRSPYGVMATFYEFEYRYCTKIQFFKKCDIVIISSDVIPLPYYFYGDQHEYDRFFSEIAFLFRKDEIDSEGTVCLEGNSIALLDQKRTRYEVLSATLNFDNEFDYYGYNHGSFEVTYKTLSGETAQLKDGRFKLLPPSYDGLNGNLYQKYFPDLYANDKDAQEEIGDFII